MGQWYFARNGQQGGPVEQEQLAQMVARGELSATDLVWREGMDAWASPTAVAELRPAPAPRQSYAAAPQPAYAPAPPSAPAPYSPPRQQQPMAQPFAPQPHYGQPAPMGYGLAPRSGSSALGVASFIIGLVVLVVELGCIALAAVLVQGGKASNDPSMIGAGLGIIGGLALCLVGAILGLVSLSRSTSRVLGILGIIINGGILLLVIALMAIGFAAKP